jgi:hypothetical protein
MLKENGNVIGLESFGNMGKRKYRKTDLLPYAWTGKL